MDKYKHPTIINFIGYSFEDIFGRPKVTIFMELAENGSLFDLLDKVKKGMAPPSYDNTIRQIILIGIARGLMHLHKHNIIHCDLKPGNILLDSDFHPHITDFGLSKIFQNKSTMSATNQFGTLVYMAPELIERGIYNRKVDVYSFGILMYEVVTHSIPYPLLNSGEISIYQFQRKVIDENYRPVFNTPVKKSLQTLIERCWSKNPDDRPSFSEIFQKLAFNVEDTIFDISDNKYFLDDVEVEEIYTYLDSIQNYDQNKNSHDSDQLFKKIQMLENIIIPLKEENEAIKKENKVIKEKQDILENDINVLKQENIRIKKLLKYILEQQSSSIHDINYNLFDSENREINYSNKQDNITIQEFNSLEIKSQQTCIANIISRTNNAKMKDYFTNINNLFLYILKFVQLRSSPSSSFIVISHNDDKEILQQASEKHLIHILSYGTELLFINRSLISPEFTNILKNFKNISIEIAYPSKYFEPTYNIISTLKKSQEIDIGIFITSINKVDPFFMKNTNINNVRVDASVLSIEQNAFLACAFLKQIAIPPSVSFIGPYSFLGCSSLRKIVIPCSVVEISDGVFKNCSLLVEIEIPTSVTSIKSEVFCGCKSLEEITIPSSVEIIGNNVFCGCVSLRKITIPSSVKSIGNNCFNGISSLQIIGTIQNLPDNLFYGCIYLTEITIPSFVNTIGNNVFCGCSSLKEIVIPSSVEIIGDNVFYGCVSLRKITIPSSVKSIGNNCFNGTSSLQITGTIQNLPDNLFNGCTNLTEITIPSSVNTIGNNVFCGCSSLKEIVIPSSVEIIGSCVFYGCVSLRNISIPSSVKGIGNNVFYCCSSLKEIEFLSSTKIIYNGVFYECKSLEKIIIPSFVNAIGHYAFCGCSSLKEIVIPSSVEIIGDNVFNGCVSLRKVTIPSSVKSIGNNCFNGTSSLQITGTIQNLPDNLFYGCTNLAEITIPSFVNTIGNNVFFGCSSLKEIVIPSSVEIIGDNAFNGCVSLRNISIPSSVKSIGQFCFNDCANISHIVFESPVRICSNSFENCSSLRSFEIKSIEIQSRENGESLFENYNLDINKFNEFNGETQTLIFELDRIIVNNSTKNNGSSNVSSNKKIMDHPNYYIKQNCRYNIEYNTATISKLLFSISNKLSKFQEFSNFNYIYMSIYGKSNKKYEYIFINSKIVEIIFANNLFNPDELLIDSPYFVIDIEYPSKYFNEIYHNIIKYHHELIFPDSFNISLYITCNSMDDRRFQGNKNIDFLKVDSSVKSIGQFCFKDCTNLSHIIFESPVKICSNSFENCLSLRSFEITSLKFKTNDSYMSFYDVFNKFNGEIQTLIFGLKSITDRNQYSKEISDLLFSLSNKLLNFQDKVSNINYINVYEYPKYSNSKYFFINSKIIEIMFVNNMFNHSELFIRSQNVGIEIEYPSDLYFSLINKVIEYKLASKAKFCICLLIKGNYNVNDYWKLDVNINWLKIDKSLGSINKDAFSNCSSLEFVVCPFSLQNREFTWPSNTKIITIY